jgi:hypothetical protein
MNILVAYDISTFPLEHHVKWSKPGSERQRPHEFCHTWKIEPKDKHIHKKQTWSYTNSFVEHVCNSGAILWNLGKEGKKREQ